MYVNMTEEGFVRGKSSGSIYASEGLDITLAVHGDDFYAEGEPECLDVLDMIMEKHFVVKKAPRIGPGAATSGQFLNRVIGYDPKRVAFTWEADPKHVPLLLKDLGLLGAKPRTTPGEKNLGHKSRRSRTSWSRRRPAHSLPARGE